MRILALTHRLPYAPNRGDRLRAYHILKYLKLRANLDLVSLVHDDDEAAHASDMAEVASTVTVVHVPKYRNHLRGLFHLAGEVPLTHLLLDGPGRPAAVRTVIARRPPDVVFAYGSGTARWALEAPLNELPLVIDFVDMDSQKWRELAGGARMPLSWIYRREAKHLGAFEARAALAARTNLVVNAREAGIASRLSPAATVRIIENGVDLEGLRPAHAPVERPQVVFCGVMNYAPNHHGIMWFIERVWPLVTRERTDATLAVVGSDPERALLAAATRDRSITVTGRVPDVRQWLWDSAIGIAPLHVARGLQNKVLEAIATGLPVVATSAVEQGLPPLAMPAVSVGDTEKDFASHVLRLLSMPARERRQLAESADLNSLTWSHTLEPLWPIFERAIRRE
jgi:sugar transferase (PEP-CTERM/EpsH1 system associated)